MLDRIPGAWERAREGNGQIDAGQGIPLAQLCTHSKQSRPPREVVP